MKQNKKWMLTELYIFIILVAFASYWIAYLISKWLKKFFELEASAWVISIVIFFLIFAFLHLQSVIQEYKDKHSNK